MIVWFEALPLLEKVFFFIALPSTVILIIQTVMLFFGGMDDGSLLTDTSGFESPPADFSAAAEAISSDFDDAGGPSAGGDLSFITVRGVIAFLTVAGWTGVTCMEFGMSAAISTFAAILFGAGALVSVAYLIRALLSLQTTNQVNYRAALGKTGDVYLPIPPNNSGTGKVSLSLGGKYTQYDAVTNQDTGVKTGELVRVVDIIRGTVMVVEAEEAGEK